MERFKGKRLPVRWASYLFGMFMLTLGIAMSVRSDLGTSPVSSIPHALTKITGIDMTFTTMIFQGLLVVIEAIILRRNFKPIYILQFPVGILFGLFTGMSNGIIGAIPMPDYLWFRFLLLAVSLVFVAIGIFFYLPANIMNLPSEGFMQAIVHVTGIQFFLSKIFFDCGTVIIAAGLSLIFMHSLGSVGIGTVAAAVLVGFIIKLLVKLFGKARDRLLVVPGEKEPAVQVELTD